MTRSSPRSVLSSIGCWAALLAPWTGARAATAFSCDRAEEVYEELLGEVDGQPLHLRVCTSPEGDAQRTLILSHWTAPEGEASDVWQTLFDGSATPVAGAYTLHLEDGRLTLFYPSGTADDPEGQVTTDTWTWSGERRHFEGMKRLTTSPWAERKASFDAAVASGDAEAARVALQALGATPNGGRTWLDDELYTTYLGVVQAEALRRHRLFDAAGAASLAWTALADPPVTSPEAAPREGQLVICRDLAPTCSGKGSFNDLPADAAHANVLAALAFVIARGEQPERALPLLDVLLAAFPGSGDLYRIRGDAQWEAGREDAARESWRRARDLGVALPRKTARRLGD